MKAIFNIEQFLAMAKLLNETLAEVENLRETNDMLSDQLASKAELSEAMETLDKHNGDLLDANISLARESEALEGRVKFLNDLVLHQSNTISNLQGHVRDLKQDLSRFTCPIDEEEVKKQEEEKWVAVEARLTPADYANKIYMIKIVKEVFGMGLRDAKDAMEMHFFDLGKLKPRFAEQVQPIAHLNIHGHGRLIRIGSLPCPKDDKF